MSEKNCRSVEVGEDVNVHAEESRASGHKNQCGDNEHCEAVVERCMYYSVQHRAGLLFLVVMCMSLRNDSGCFR